MRIVDRAEERFATTSGQLVLDRPGDEAAPISFEVGDPPHPLGRQRDGDALSAHDHSMTQSMIILKVPLAADFGEPFAPVAHCTLSACRPCWHCQGRGHT